MRKIKSIRSLLLCLTAPVFFTCSSGNSCTTDHRRVVFSERDQNH
jgi:hypothetical protein